MPELMPKASQAKKFFSEFPRKGIGAWKVAKKQQEAEAKAKTPEAMNALAVLRVPPNLVTMDYGRVEQHVWSQWTTGSAVTINTPTTMIWDHWNLNYQATYATAASCNSVWYNWNTGTGSALATNQQAVQIHQQWAHWNNQHTQQQVIQGMRTGREVPHHDIVPARHIVAQTPEEIAAQRERERVTNERYMAEQQARAAAAKLADMRARHLLMENLSPRQKAMYEKNSFFDVEVAGKTYRIRKGWSGNVELLGKDKVEDKEVDVVMESFCIHPREIIPADDNVLLQKLLLETSEEEFRKTANITRHDPRWRPRALTPRA